MTTYINRYWNDNNRRRDYEATNVCFAVAESNTPNAKNWQQTDESVPANMAHLYTEAGVRYYGYL